MAAGNWAGFALAGGLAFTGCASGPSLSVDSWDSRMAATVHTVAMAGGERTIVLSDTYAEVPASAFSESVLGLLAARGFTQADTGAADLWLRAHLLLKRNGGRQEGGGGPRHGREGGRREGREGAEGRAPAAGAGPEGRPRASSDVEVVLELVRRVSGETVWTGTATAILAHPFWSPEGRRELVDLAARLLAPVHGAAV
jgi:hypothetical protein